MKKNLAKGSKIMLPEQDKRNKERNQLLAFLKVFVEEFFKLFKRSRKRQIEVVYEKTTITKDGAQKTKVKIISENTTDLE